ncbi:MAG TPA: hypothetical protein PKA00_04385 [Saprospiraceae bacterium]|nr:hypothetical protein [Saprospiraceae bacterium]HMQ82117.1 hypothetical protein [Saprospiraceae bacterium]
MNTLFRFFAFCAMILLASCSTTEEIWINSDGTGRFAYHVDMSELYPFLMMGLQQELNPTAPPEEDGDGTLPPDSVIERDKAKDAVEQLLAKESLDTIIYVKPLVDQLLAKEGMTTDDLWQKLRDEDNEDMTKAEKEKFIGAFQDMMGMDIRLQMNQQESKFIFTLGQAFDDPNEAFGFLGTLMELLEKTGQGGDAEKLAAVKDGLNSTTKYQLKGSSLNISRKPTNLDALQEEGGNEQMAMMQMFMGGSKYKMVIHLPGKVKSADFKGAEVDGQTVTIEMPLSDLYDEKGALDFDIKFKPKKNITWSETKMPEN